MSIMKEDYYHLLGVPKGADDKTIKASYRKLARKYHPDLNPGDKAAEAKFKEISQAYDVLSDPEKRKLYDRYGSQWDQVQQGGGHGAPNVDVDFGDLGSIFDQFFQQGPKQARRQPTVAAKDIEKSVDVTLQEIDSGTKRVLTYQVMDSCKSCEGTGQVQLRNRKPCPTCNGTGVQRSIFGQTVCQHCQGAGSTNLEVCPTCRGECVIPTSKKVEIVIPAGIHDGKKLRVPGRGSLGSGGRAGDLYVTVKEIKDPHFTRRGDELETEVEVPFAKAILGGEIQVRTLRGSVTMRIPECTQQGQTFRLAEQGISQMKGKRGNLLVRIKITTPKQINSKMRSALQQFAEAEVSL